MRKPQSKLQPPSLRQRMIARVLPALAAFATAMLGLPVNAAITLPTDPLTTGVRVPPNILFILDNSGSMAYAYMPDSVRRVGTTTPSTSTLSCGSNMNSTSMTYLGCNTYTRNGVYYNPTLGYQPWTLANGTLMTGGGDYNNAYSDNTFVPYTGAGPTGTGTITTTSGTVNLQSTVNTFYVPKCVDTSTGASTSCLDPNTTSGEDYYATGTNYYRYQILTDGSIYRSEYLAYTSANTPAGNSASGTLGTMGTSSAGAYSSTWNFTVPSDARNLVVTVSGGSVAGTNRGADLFVRQGNSTVTTSNYTYRSRNNGNEEAVTDNAPAAGAWYVRLYAQTAFTGPVTVTYSYDFNFAGAAAMGCDTTTDAATYGWRNCTRATPTGRSEAAERANFATWYSYHRTRYKAAKAGASAAFAELDMDANVRVGFRTIWNNSNIPAASAKWNMPTPAVPIPVAYNNGLFTDTGTTANPSAYNNRTQWYNRLFTTTGSGSTPLRQALTDAGIYFSNDAASGPYGPEVGADQLACRQNFTILTTDGYWNETYNNSTIGDADATPGSAITNSTGGSYTYTPAAPYSGGLASDGTPTLADVAMYYWRNDLRTGTGMDNIVPTSAKDPAFWQHMVTFTIGLGLVGTVDQESVEAVLASGNATVNGTAGWPAPVNNSITAVDDLLHAAVNGHGTYVAASNPTAFASGLKAALAAVTERTGSFSNISANSAALSTGSKLFQASYVSGVWTGEVAAYPVSSTGASSSPSWRASQGIPTTNRKVLTSDGTQLLAFPASATTTQLAALERTGGVNSYPVTGAANAAYLAGDRSLEIANGGTLRNRNTLLGDVVGSSPAYVVESDTLYVGGNDGMLHAFNASTGAELFGFIPSGINWSKLGTLSRPDYSHGFFVDGPVVVSTRAQTPAKNILVGALGKGGKGLFALDVTAPSSPVYKWEVGGSDTDMGLVQNPPLIAKVRIGAVATNVLIVGNGVNSSNGTAALFIYNLETGALIKKIQTGVGSSVQDHADSNGLLAPVGWDADGNGMLDYVYAGDMLGNVWKFDLSATTSASWGRSKLFEATYTKSDGSVVRQPITGGLTVAMHPTNYKTWLFFGTGRLMTPGDMNNDDVQSMYGIIDDGTTLVRNGTGANLTQRNAVLAGSVNGKSVRAFETNSPLPSDSKGWYLDLLTPPSGVAEGERIVTAAQVLGSGKKTALVTSSVIPTASACQSDGRGYINALDAFTGTSLSSPFFDTDGDGRFDDETLTAADGTKLPVGSVDLGVGMPTLPNLMSGGSGNGVGTPPGMMCVTGSNGQVVCVPYDDIRNLGRVSWREIKRGN